MEHNKTPPPKPFNPSARAMRRSVASSTALEIGLTVQQLEQKLLNRCQNRFAHIKLAD